MVDTNDTDGTAYNAMLLIKIFEVKASIVFFALPTLKYNYPIRKFIDITTVEATLVSAQRDFTFLLYTSAGLHAKVIIQICILY